MSKNPQTLDFTGERFTPECVREMAYEHWHRYAWAKALTANKVVADVACGEGYGSHLLAQTAQSVIGVDVDEKTIAHAKARYAAPNLEFVQADALSLPLDTDSVDVVVSFETIEHLQDHDGLLTEFKRILRPDGYLILSSPDKASYSDQTGYDNPFHEKELYREELEALLAKHFPSHRLWCQKLSFASVIWPLECDPLATGATEWHTQHASGIEQGPAPTHPPQYFVAIASMAKGKIHAPNLSFFDDEQESIYRHYQAEIRHHMESGKILASKDAEMEALKKKLHRPWWRRLWPRSDS